MKPEYVFKHPLFTLGFRAFFLLAGLSALILLLVWNVYASGTGPAAVYYPARYWHAHEMLFGYAAAVIAGFLLTAIRNWTGKESLYGDGLAGLCLVWLYGRILPFYAGMLPDGLIALVDFIFFPLLAYCAGKRFVASKHYENFTVIGFLLVLTVSNGLIHGQLLGFWHGLAQTGIYLALATTVLLILFIAGRVLPFFTERGVSGILIIKNPLADRLSLASATGFFLSLVFSSPPPVIATLAILAAVANFWRLSTWYTRRIWYVPLLWVLYWGYGWIILGFLLSALASYGLVSHSLALHAFAVGGMGVLTLGMMARVSLGHTGRLLKAPGAVVIAFWLINIAALCRVVLPIVLPDWHNNLIYLATLCWLAAFALFVFVYAPILTAPRIDGKAD